MITEHSHCEWRPRRTRCDRQAVYVFTDATGYVVCTQHVAPALQLALGDRDRESVTVSRLVDYVKAQQS